MKSSFLKTVLVLCLAFGLVTYAKAQFVTATITVTNVPNNGDTVVLNGTTFTFETTVTVPASQVTIGVDANTTATNLFLELEQNPLVGTVIAFSSTNVVRVQGPAVTASFTGTWGTVATASVSTTNSQALTLPLTSIPATQATNLANYLINAINSFATTPISAAAPAMANFIGISSAFLSGGIVTNSLITNATGISGTVNSLTNGSWTNPSLTNGRNFGNPFRSPGTGTGSEQFGLSAVAGANDSIAIGDTASTSARNAIAIGGGATASQIASVAVGESAISSGGGSAAFGNSATASADATTALGFEAQATAPGATAIGTDSTAAFTNSTAVGYNVSTTQTNQVILGNSAGSVSVPGYLNVAGGAQIIGNVTNLNTVGTNTLAGEALFPVYANTSLANGANAAVSVGTNVYVKVSGPSAAFSINGIVPGSPAGGRWIWLQNSTGQTMTLANDSGVDPAATNRIYTGSGSDFSIPSNPGIASLFYDAALSHWILMSVNGLQANGGSGSFSGTFSGVGTGLTISAANLSGVAPIANGGTAASTAQLAAANVGTLYAGSASQNIWTTLPSVSPSYAGQVVTAEPFGTANSQPMNLMIASGTGSGNATNPISIPYGISQTGNPSFMAPGFPWNRIYTGGNPLDQTNANTDGGLWVCYPNPHNSGSAITFPWQGTNAAFGNTQTWPGFGTTVTNAAGEVSYMHDGLAMTMGMTPDGCGNFLVPSGGFIVMNATANAGFAPHFSLFQAAGGPTAGNYSYFQTYPEQGYFDLGWWTNGIFTSTNPSWRFSLRADVNHGTVYTGTNFYVGGLLYGMGGAQQLTTKLGLNPGSMDPNLILTVTNISLTQPNSGTGNPAVIINGGYLTLSVSTGGEPTIGNTTGALMTISDPGNYNSLRLQQNINFGWLNDGVADIGTTNGGGYAMRPRTVYAKTSINIGNVNISTGSGSPNSAVTGSPGDIYYNTAGGSATTLWVKESGSATTTGWVGK